jgi:integrase
MARRNANGEGSAPYRRKDGRWEAAGYFLTTSGVRKRKSFYGATRQEAHDKLVVAKAQAQQGVPVPDRTWRVGEYLDHWLEQVILPNRRPKTYITYSQRVRLNLKPGLGKYRLTSLSVSAVQSFFKQRLADGHSIRKVHMMREVLRSALSRAMRDELIFRNVARLVDLPSYQPEEFVPWSAQEARRFLQAARQHRLYLAFLLFLLFGLREGEVLGLRWCDVDVERQSLRIRQQVQRVNGIWQAGPVKTKTGRRDLPLIGIVREALHEHQQRQLDERSQAGESWQESRTSDGLVFTSPNGLPIDPRGLLRMFRRLCTKHGLRQIRIHDTRHTVGTILKDLGVPDRDIQLILGHANISTTQAIYQHGNTPAQREAIEKTAALLFPQEDGSETNRHLLPSNLSSIGVQFKTKFGADRGIRTHDPLFTNSNFASISDRFAEVNSILDVVRRRWNIGIVAVNNCRRNQMQHQPLHIRNAGASACFVHAPRTSASTRPVLSIIGGHRV